VDRSADFTKGCYVGQELVARIDSRGSNTPTKLRAIRFLDAGAQVPKAGAAIRSGGDDVGELTSVSTATAGSPVGLGYVKRAVDVPAEAEVIAADGSALAVELTPLP
jgi:folate-binding Fe-S cluster repair protein YgfZ